MIRKFRGQSPRIDPSAFVAETAVLIGDVAIGPDSSVWYNAVLRGDDAPISIGRQTNIQDHCLLHDRVTIGDRVTVGHQVVLHGCIVEDDALIGMGAIVLDGAVIGHGALVAAGSLVLANTRVEPYTLVAGRPAVFKKQLDSERIDHNEASAKHYWQILKDYQNALE